MRSGTVTCDRASVQGRTSTVSRITKETYIMGLLQSTRRTVAGAAAVAALSTLAVGAMSAPASADASTPFTVRIESLLCNVTEDWTGPDEPYLLGNNNRIWGNGSLNDRQSTNVGVSFGAIGTASIKLYDADAGSWIDPDDFLGEIVVDSSALNQGRQTGRFTLDGANYEITYYVLPA